MKDLKLKKLNRSEMKFVVGGMVTWCRRRSTNLEDYRPGAPECDEGFLNSNGCWVYAGMPANAHPDCGPSSANYFVMGGSGQAC